MIYVYLIQHGVEILPKSIMTFNAKYIILNAIVESF